MAEEATNDPAAQLASLQAQLTAMEAQLVSTSAQHARELAYAKLGGKFTDPRIQRSVAREYEDYAAGAGGKAVGFAEWLDQPETKADPLLGHLFTPATPATPVTPVTPVAPVTTPVTTPVVGLAQPRGPQAPALTAQEIRQARLSGNRDAVRAAAAQLASEGLIKLPAEWGK